MRRRTLLTSGLAASLSLAGCVGYRLSGCESQNRYILKLTEVDQAVLRTDPIPYRNLSANEQRLIRKTLDTGRFETCPGEGSDEDRGALFEFQSRVQDHSENGYAYLTYDGRYFQIGLVISAVYYARTKHHPDETPSPVDTSNIRTP
ncbi:MAG: hypothetical protein U5J98_02965 [Halobacteriales archaeon]|nr:hypothetical protein [Halobacteriales archaeon]